MSNPLPDVLVNIFARDPMVQQLMGDIVDRFLKERERKERTMNGTTSTTVATAASAMTVPPEIKDEGVKIEIAVCESVFESIIPNSRGNTSKRESRALYHVEVRFIPRKGAHSITFQGACTRDRAQAEAEKSFVESVIKSSTLKKPKPVKERARKKRRSRKS
jgi:hypothetical protein